MESSLVIIGLLLIGIILILIEVMLIPGTTIVGIAGGIMLVIGIYYAYSAWGTIYGHYTLGITLLLTAGTIYLGFKAGLWYKFANKSKLEGKVIKIDNSIIEIGVIGETVSELRPVGYAMFNDQKIEVQSKGEYIESQKKIRIVKIDGNKVTVELT